MCVCVCVCVCSCSVVPDSVWSHELQSTRLLCPWDFPVRDTRVGCHFLLQGIFLIEWWKLCLLYLRRCQADSLPLSHLRSLEDTFQLHSNLFYFIHKSCPSLDRLTFPVGVPKLTTIYCLCLKFRNVSQAYMVSRSLGLWEVNCISQFLCLTTIPKSELKTVNIFCLFLILGYFSVSIPAPLA